MIKNYLTFIKENKELFSDYISNILDNSEGEKLEFLKGLINQYLLEIDQKVDLDNAINILDDSEKSELKRRIESFLNNEEKDPDVLASVNISESYGSNVLNTFFKCLTALGLKDNKPQTENTPDDFLFIYNLNNLELNKVKSVFDRFRSLSLLEIDWSNPSINLYFGLKLSGHFEYGYYYDEFKPIGEFKLIQSTLNKLKTSDLKSTTNLRKLLVNLSMNDIILACRIKPILSNLDIKFTERRCVHIQDRILTISYLQYRVFSRL